MVHGWNDCCNTCTFSREEQCSVFKNLRKHESVELAIYQWHTLSMLSSRFATSHSSVVNSNFHSFMSWSPVIVSTAAWYLLTTTSISYIEFHLVVMSWGSIQLSRLSSSSIWNHHRRARVDKFLIAYDTLQS